MIKISFTCALISRSWLPMDPRIKFSLTTKEHGKFVVIKFKHTPQKKLVGFIKHVLSNNNGLHVANLFELIRNTH